MVLAESMIQIRCHCRSKRETHGTPLLSWIFIRSH